MSELHDTSSIPDGDTHWNAMAARVAAYAEGASHARDEEDRNPLTWFANSRATWAAASALLAAGVVFTVLTQRDSTGVDATADWTSAMSPPEGLARVVMSTDGPPAVGTLLLVSRLEGRR